MNGSGAAVIIASLGVGGVLVAIVNALFQRRKVGADATAVLAAAARELVAPLTKELADERAGRAADRAAHSEEISMERRNVRALRDELQAARGEAAKLRAELTEAWREVDRLRQRLHEIELGADHQRVTGTETIEESGTT